MKVKTVLVASMAIGSIGLVTQSCLAVATSGIGIAVLKQVLLGGITKGVGIFSNKNAFMQNDLINQALPAPLREINSVLERISPSLVQKEKEYIAQAAAYTVQTAEPILRNAVNSLTPEDVRQVANGGKGAATRLLKAKTADQLMLAIQPKVDEKLNEYGIVKSLNLALQGNNLLGGLLGTGDQNLNLASGGLSRLASEQMVEGLFKIIENHEMENSFQLLNALQNTK